MQSTNHNSFSTYFVIFLCYAMQDMKVMWLDKPHICILLLNFLGSCVPVSLTESKPKEKVSLGVYP